MKITTCRKKTTTTILLRYPAAVQPYISKEILLRVVFLVCWGLFVFQFFLFYDCFFLKFCGLMILFLFINIIFKYKYYLVYQMVIYFIIIKSKDGTLQLCCSICIQRKFVFAQEWIRLSGSSMQKRVKWGYPSTNFVKHFVENIM